MENILGMLCFKNKNNNQFLFRCRRPSYHSNSNKTCQEWFDYWYSFKLKAAALNGIVYFNCVYLLLIFKIAGLY